MFPVLVVAVACVGFALNILSTNEVVQRHPTVRKFATLTSRWTHDQHRRFLDGINATKVELQASATSFSRWVRAPIASLRPTATPTPVHVYVRAPPQVVIAPLVTDITIYQPGEVQLSAQAYVPAAGTCPPRIESTNVNIEVYRPGEVQVYVPRLDGQCLARFEVGVAPFSVPGVNGATDVSNGVAFLPCLVAFAFVIYVLHLMFPSKGGKGKKQRSFRQRTSSSKVSYVKHNVVARHTAVEDTTVDFVQLLIPSSPVVVDLPVDDELPEIDFAAVLKAEKVAMLGRVSWCALSNTVKVAAVLSDLVPAAIASPDASTPTLPPTPPSPCPTARDETKVVPPSVVALHFEPAVQLGARATSEVHLEEAVAASIVMPVLSAPAAGASEPVVQEQATVAAHKKTRRAGRKWHARLARRAERAAAAKALEQEN